MFFFGGIARHNFEVSGDHQNGGTSRRLDLDSQLTSFLPLSVFELSQLIMTATAVVVVDSLGRRPLLLGGVSGMVIALFLLGSYYLFLNDALTIAIVGLLLYVGCYQVPMLFYYNYSILHI
ncbi:hypothetical protein K1719_039824 [Acacia pycnantha]|nr:hypothetical protein K1719_039824 [Acacia pycnantha]